jgi:hypothetical protein
MRNESPARVRAVEVVGHDEERSLHGWAIVALDASG